MNKHETGARCLGLQITEYGNHSKHLRNLEAKRSVFQRSKHRMLGYRQNSQRLPPRT
ncbi:hypothetical protein ONE56_01030 [Vibrio mytili]|uniref:hypothetical protein n=1 Tax=Vibrio mytili TaxID=50718 RepID=UPI003C704725